LSFLIEVKYRRGKEGVKGEEGRKE